MAIRTLRTTQEMAEKVLGIKPPWYVERIDCDEEEREIHVHLAFPRGSVFFCGNCGLGDCKAHDTRARKWQCRNFSRYRTYIHARAPRVRCESCRGVRTAELPWARPISRFTRLFEADALGSAPGTPTAQTARRLGVNDARLHRVVRHYVDKALANVDLSKVRSVGVDEKAARRGHDYITLFVDLDTKKLIFATKNRTHDVFREFRERLEAQGGSAAWIREICMDMSPAYMKGAREEFPRAGITFDRFHVAKLMNQAVEQVRRAEQKRRPDLKNTRWLWLKSRDSLSEAEKAKLEKLLADTAKSTLETAEAYKFKLAFREFWRLPPTAAEAYLERWRDKAPLCGLEPLERFARTVLDHWRGILRWSTTRLSNGLVEGFNSLIQAAKVNARGYRTTQGILHMAYLKCAHLKFDLPT